MEGLCKRAESKGIIRVGQVLDDEHSTWIQQRAGLACEFLQEARHKEVSQISAISSKGNKFRLNFASEQEELRSEKVLSPFLNFPIYLLIYSFLTLNSLVLQFWVTSYDCYD